MNMAIRTLTFLLIMISALWGCSHEYSDADLVFVNVSEGRKIISHPEGSLFKEAKPNAWIDPRRVELYSSGHIPGAINLPFKNVAVEWEDLEGYGVVIVYGKTYNDPIADAMSKSLMEYGIHEVRTLRGGIEAWIKAGYPVTKGRKP
jgi:rhodanese-related sulfurtransferase